MIKKYIYDFVSFERKLVIELDGSQHMERAIREKDGEKQKYAEELGYRILRFSNNDIQENLEGVLEVVRLVMQ